MTNIVNVNIKKSDMAISLELQLGISWDLYQHHPFDAGYDVRACILEPTILVSGERETISTGLFFEIQSPYWELQVRPRSGLAHKYGITIVNSPGTIDFAYRDEVKVILMNLGGSSFTINPGDRIAQICLRYVPLVSFNYVSNINETIYETLEKYKEQEIKETNNSLDSLKAEAKIKRGGFGSSGNK